MRVALMLGLVGLLAACGGNTSNPGAGCEGKVEMSGFAFGPQTVTVKSGGCVTFTNKDIADHDVKVNTTPQAANPTFGEELVPQIGQNVSRDTRAITQALSYVCSIHPSMKGTITVQ